VGELCHVMGARFKALDALIFIEPSVLPCIFRALDCPMCFKSDGTDLKIYKVSKEVLGAR